VRDVQLVPTPHRQACPNASRASQAATPIPWMTSTLPPVSRVRSAASRVRSAALRCAPPARSAPSPRRQVSVPASNARRVVSRMRPARVNAIRVSQDPVSRTSRRPSAWHAQRDEQHRRWGRPLAPRARKVRTPLRAVAVFARSACQGSTRIAPVVRAAPRVRQVATAPASDRSSVYRVRPDRMDSDWRMRPASRRVPPAPLAHSWRRPPVPAVRYARRVNSRILPRFSVWTAVEERSAPGMATRTARRANRTPTKRTTEHPGVSAATQVGRTADTVCDQQSVGWYVLMFLFSFSPPGYTTVYAASICLLCPNGKYSDLNNDKTCTDCEVSCARENIRSCWSCE
jgi:hypothetical protein